jgi:hypothetical protein
VDAGTSSRGVKMQLDLWLDPIKLIPATDAPTGGFIQ